MKIINNFLQKFFDINTFKLVFLVSCFFYCIPFTNFIFVKIFKLFIVWGAITFLYNFFWNKKFVLKKQDYLLFVFLIIAFVGCIFNFKSNLIDNIISVAYLFVQTVLMVSYNRKSTLEQKIKEIKNFSKVVVLLTFPCAVISLLIFLLNFKLSFKVGFQQYVFGVFEGRLWGVQGNPNTLAQWGLMSIFFSVLLVIINKKNQGQKNQRGFLYVNIVLQSICCILSNSRSTNIGLYVSLVFLALVIIGLKKKEKTQSVAKVLLKNKLTTLGKLACVLACVMLTSFVAKQGMLLASLPFKNVDLDFLVYFEEDEKEEEDDEKSKIEREYLTSDFSNGRFEIWQGAAKVVMKNPVFGVGVKNVNKNVNKYMSKATVTLMPKLSENMHNIYFQVLISHGILGFAVFAIYLICVIAKILKFLFTFKSSDENDEYIYKLVAICACVICSLLIINLFDSNILYFCSIFLVVVFWNTISIINSLIDSVSNEKRKVLFTISNLGGGGAEKVLIDITNNINFEENEVEVKTIFNEGKYIKDLNENIKYSYILKNPTLLKKRILSRVIKYFPQKFVYNWFITDNYDVEIAFLESLPVKLLCGSNSSAAKIAWVHVDIFGLEDTLKLFKNKKRLVKCYQNFDRVVCVSDSVKQSFEKNTNLHQDVVTIYNPIDKNQVIEKSKQACDMTANKDKFTMVTIGRLTQQKGYLRLCEVINKLTEHNKNIELWILGEGPEREKIEEYINQNSLQEYIKLLGFKDNPYSYLNQADLFVSSSIAEGYSLVLAEAMVLGLPVLSTNTTGPDNLLEHGKYGYIVDNSFEGLYTGLKDLIDNPSKLEEIKQKVVLRQDFFGLEDKIEQVEALFGIKEEINKESDLFCTVFTPTYNRGYILEKLYESLKKQTDKDFEWVVVDDGSSDNTQELFEKWSKADNGFKINYQKVSNGGKQRAINKGLDLAKGKMFFIVDSDDSLAENAIERLKFYEATISDCKDFAGISGLRGYNMHDVIGKRNHNDFVDATNQQREEFNLTGDKAECYYLDLLKRYRFPEVEGEKFVSECIVWDKLASDGYKIRWFNEIIYLGNYLEDGYTNEGNTLFQRNPIGFLLYVRNDDIYYPLDLKRKIGNYCRYYEMMRDKKQIKEIADDLLTSVLFLRFAEILFNIKRKIKGK